MLLIPQSRVRDTIQTLRGTCGSAEIGEEVGGRGGGGGRRLRLTAFGIQQTGTSSYREESG